MTNKYSHSILLVDDEESITKSLRRLFRREGYNIATASSGQEGLDLLQKVDKPISLIISDQRMPGMNGAEFLEKAKGIHPHSIRFLLTGYSDMDAIVDAINRGEINRYITKPWNDNDLVLQVQQALEQYELAAENRRLTELTKKQNKDLSELNKNLEEKVRQRTKEIVQKNEELNQANERLEKSFMDTIRLLSSVITTLNPELGGYMSHVAQLAKELGEDFGLSQEELDQLEMAGMVHDLGLLGLPKKVLSKPEGSMTKAELDMFSEHPVIAAMSLEPIEQLNQIGEVILFHHEHFNGSGYPNGLRGDEIPLKSRILGTVADYCKVIDTWPKETRQIMNRAHKYKEILNDIILEEPQEMLRKIAKEIIWHGANRKYDVEVATKLLKRIENTATTDEGKKILKIHYEDVKEGMVLAKDLRVNDGRLLVSKGTSLRAASVKSIQAVGRRRLIESHVYVSHV
ncbi:MAG: HD domain-containing phosphohydrolase [Desulfatiglans sp.]|jgi:response regulator RpfG family c-di-GMP phosphodiesterase|nr:HD domain-containing phosphohydrolase [Desulfatiglans sp.]